MKISATPLSPIRKFPRQLAQFYSLEDELNRLIADSDLFDERIELLSVFFQTEQTEFKLLRLIDKHMQIQYPFNYDEFFGCSFFEQQKKFTDILEFCVLSVAKKYRLNEDGYRQIFSTLKNRFINNNPE